MNKIAILTFALLPSWLLVGNASSSTAPLTLDEVQSSAQQAFPSLLAAKQRQQAAAGEYQTAEGAFDTVLKVQNRWSVTGLYQNRNNDISIEQPTSLGGTTFFGGWRRGIGDYPVYDGKSLTATDGEARLGVNIPLWRNREIDQRRASLKQAELGQMIAGHEYDQILLEIRRLAAHRYWDWVLAGQRLQIAKRMLHIAEQRDAGIRKRVTAGDIPKFEALDNQRAIIERRERRVLAQRMLEQSAIQLSLYWRDAEGRPRMPVAEQLPSGFPGQEPTITLDYSKALQTAQVQRPELRRLDMQSRQTQTELELQQNQRAPDVDLSMMGAKDIGNGKDNLNRNELYVGLNVSIPLQRRVASGRAQVAGANLQRLKSERILLEDRIAAELKDILSALSAARQRQTLTLLQQTAAQKLEEGERTRFELGDSTLLIVNLREIAHGDAALLAAEAASNLFKGYADYQAALGLQAKGTH
ncbi:MAG: TolC family protein [Candidatus Nitrotoga sp.]|nr:TolC family protein [Candidatus Nitrotoga sp.]MDO9446974.1 TolC family protein [Candidatus Nitrotoga sp.]MDP1637620.1 TolC family protein [Candidatus Nitrotoga sp.]MDP1856898.1 TolC family protein [Candidatus Nitrotoga sp.]MDP3496694.1 TolC family protein [Candidatus Nitrotoga sp.]